MDQRVQFLKIVNDTDHNLEVDFEPIAYSLVYKPGETLRLGALCPLGESLNISVYSANRLRVWYEGSTVWVQEEDGSVNTYVGGRDITGDDVPRFPD